VSLVALGRYEFQPGNLYELALERRGDIVGHGVGTRARVVHLHLDDRVVHSWQVVHWQLPIAQVLLVPDGRVSAFSLNRCRV
jgi:hypothetical protein